MATEVVMPTLGLTMEEGTILRWLKQEGETVQKDEPLFEVETDKAAMEVPAPASGVLQRILADAGATVPTRQAIAIIGAPGEAVAAPAGAAPASAPAAAGVAQAAAATAAPAAPQAPAGDGAGRQLVSPRARRVAQELSVSLAQVTGSGPGGRIVERDVRAAAAAAPKAERVLASPLAKRLAAEHGVDLAGLRGTGPGGRIIERDVEAAVAARTAAPTAAPAPAPVAGEVVPLSRIRRITAERMAASSRAVARVTEFMQVDMTEAVRFRTQLAGEFEKRYGARLGYDVMFARAAAIALREFPDVNSQWSDAGLVRQAEINIATGVALEDGLIVVVQRNVDSRPLHDLQTELRALVEKARAGKLGPNDVTGSTFTITNLGAYGVDGFTPIVNPPESAILGVGRIAKSPAVVDGQLAVRDTMTLSLSFDHRVVDGAPAARFLQRVKEILEAPYILLT